MRSEPSRPGVAWRQRLSDLCVAERAFLFRLAWGILRDTHAAEDACQQAFVRASQPQGQAPDPARLRPWLAKVVVNESLQTLRRRKLEQRLRGPSPALSHSGVAADESRAARDANPFLRETVLAALEQLPEPSRLVVLLRIMHGWSGNAVKELLGCSAAEVSRRLYAGMEQLRSLLAGVHADTTKDYRYGS